MNLKDSEGESPFHIACTNMEETLRLMLKHDPDMTSTNGAGRTPLQIARFWNGDVSARIIREYLAASYARDHCFDIVEHT